MTTRDNARTEAEARECTCPATFSNHQGGSNCIGSHCMAWRWTNIARPKSIRAQDIRAIVEPPRPDDVPLSWVWKPGTQYPMSTLDYAGWREPREEAAPRDRGECGLAGRS